MICVALLLLQSFFYSSLAVPPIVHHPNQNHHHFNRTDLLKNQDFFQSFHEIYGENFVETKCNSVCDVKRNSTFNTLSSNESYLTKFIQEVNGKRFRMTLVSTVRKTITGLLTTAALKECQTGDIVETGVFAGGSSAVIMKVLLELDQCGRKFYVFDSFMGLPEPVKEDKVEDKNLTVASNKAGSFAVTQEYFMNNLKRMNVWNQSVIVIAKGIICVTGCCTSPTVFVWLMISAA